MKMGRKVTAAVGLVGLVCLVTAAAPGGARLGPQAGLDGAHYELLVESEFVEGCMGGGSIGCMCPLFLASEFAGSFTMTVNPQVPPGHQTFDLAVADWLVAFGDEQVEITGQGFYDRWTELDGSSWQRMTLDLDLYDADVHFDSGAVPNPTPGGEIPEAIHIDLDNNAECYGFIMALDAARVLPSPGRAMEDSAADRVSFVDVK